jgi:hypothetical protein
VREIQSAASVLAPWTRGERHVRQKPGDRATRTAFLAAHPMTPDLRAKYTGERLTPTKRDKPVQAVQACPCAGARHVVCLPARRWAAFVKPVRSMEKETLEVRTWNGVPTSSLSDAERKFRQLAEIVATAVDEATILEARRESLAMLRAAWAPPVTVKRRTTRKRVLVHA